MLLRKRAWDIMREDYASVREDASLSEAIRALGESRKKQPDNAFVFACKAMSQSEMFRLLFKN